MRLRSFDPWVGKTPWRREQQPTPVFLPGKSHGQRCLVGYIPWGCNELDTTEHSILYEAAYLTYTNFRRGKAGVFRCLTGFSIACETWERHRISKRGSNEAYVVHHQLTKKMWAQHIRRLHRLTHLHTAQKLAKAGQPSVGMGGRDEKI